MITVEVARDLLRDGELVTTQEGAARLGVSEKTIRKWVALGWIEPLGRSKPHLFSYPELANLMPTINNPRNSALTRARALWNDIL